MFGETYMNYLIKGVEVLYPRINKTYRFDNTENRSVPCDPFDDGASYSMQFKMDDKQAKELMGAMAAAYAEKREAKWPEKIPMPFKKTDDGMFIGKATLKGAYGKDATSKPKQYDAGNKELDEDFALTTGSVGNIAVVLFPYNMREAGVSLRLRAVQVTKYVPLQASSPFDAVEGFTVGGEVSPFADVTQSAPVTADEVDVVEVDVEDVEEPVKEPKKVAKVKSAAPKEAADLSALVDGWDD
eukprot:GHVU01146877.1.p2 GENE.GHVU01146877.1~~GHVU01146877.1.p2  ORF type:complete len:242 (-),score=41.12 GHVU01146877.1:561-1286(-)